MERDRNLPVFKAIAAKVATIRAIRAIPHISASNWTGSFEELCSQLVCLFIYFLARSCLTFLFPDEVEGLCSNHRQ